MRGVFIALVCLAAVGGSVGQPLNSNPGLPPSATATGMAPQKIVELAVQQLSPQFNESDFLNFLINTECLEARFDSYASFGTDMHPSLVGPTGGPIQGARRANLSTEILAFVQEVARDEVGHVRLMREALGAEAIDCPTIDVTAGFTALMNAAFNTTNATWDPFQDDIHFVLSMFALEEVGSTGDQGVTMFMNNITRRDATAGLAVSAGYQAAADRYILWTKRNETVGEYPFNVTVAEAFEKISNTRGALTGAADIDQPLLYLEGINIVPTDGNGVTFARTPQQVLNILVAGNPSGKGGFFPNGVNGKINMPTPLDPTVPAELLAAANAPYTVVYAQNEVADALEIVPPGGKPTAAAAAPSGAAVQAPAQVPAAAAGVAAAAATDGASATSAPAAGAPAPGPSGLISGLPTIPDTISGALAPAAEAVQQRSSSTGGRKMV